MEPDYLAIREKAEADAASSAPPPKHPPVSTAFYAAAGAAVAAMTFALILGLDLDNPKVMQGVYITAALAWVGTYFPLRSQEKQHDAATQKRFEELLTRARSQKH